MTKDLVACIHGLKKYEINRRIEKKSNDEFSSTCVLVSKKECI